MSSLSSNNILYILTILECVEKLNIYSKGFMDAEDFFSSQDQQPFNASCHLLLAIGEEIKKIEEGLKDEFSFIEWNGISGIRNRIAHDYRGIDAEIVYNIILNELGILKEVMIKMLWLSGANKELLKRLVHTQFYSHLGYLLED